MRIRTLTVRRPVQMRAEGDDFPGLDSEPLYVTEWIERRMTCRNCRSGTDLSLRGKWGDLATVVCMACDHTWPAPLPPAASVHALQAAIAQSAEKSGGLPTEPA
ncbi:hypothetical protein SNA_17980 [Streptomyces natalensis ATCC 27448]|uniref:Uncharacterized protein n=2 Tax=Streptomyces natalensis TaxID=68242 RepID=A0A0D7CLZ3_9ACTN|nr:hypothetical protein SNA_17980 [Streptomyces natalensis ATCC 27448]